MTRLLFLALPLLPLTAVGRADPIVSLVSPLPSPPVMKASELTVLAPDVEKAPSAPPSATAPVAPTEPVIVVLPNADGVLDVAGIGEGRASDPIPNPFRVRYHPQAQIREVPLLIGSVLVADRPEDTSAIINGKFYAMGDAWEGMKIAAITDNILELRLGKILLRVPVVQEKPATVRLFR